MSGTPGKNHSIVGHAPVLESMWSILAQPPTYGTMTAWSTIDGLGRRLGLIPLAQPKKPTIRAIRWSGVNSTKSSPGSSRP